MRANLGPAEPNMTPTAAVALISFLLVAFGFWMAADKWDEARDIVIVLSALTTLVAAVVGTVVGVHTRRAAAERSEAARRDAEKRAATAETACRNVENVAKAAMGRLPKIDS